MATYLLLIPLSASVLFGNVCELQEKHSGELRVYCELWDGTSVEGVFSDNDQILRLQTTSGLVPIPLAKVERIEVNDDRETTSVILANGKRLTGFVESDGFHVRTGKKSVAVAYPTLKKARIRRLWATPAENPLKVAGVRTSSVWSQSSVDGATDGKNGTSWNSGDWKGWIEVDLGKMEKIVEVRMALDFWPSGNATHIVYVSDKPIGQLRKSARLMKSTSGTRRNGDVIFAECPPETKGRYVQIYCPQSVSWFAVYEIQVFAARQVTLFSASGRGCGQFPRDVRGKVGFAPAQQKPRSDEFLNSRLPNSEEADCEPFQVSYFGRYLACLTRDE